MSTERYEIREKLGQGGVGAVYKAFDTQLNREVAIKRVLADGGYENQEEATKHLLKEATALSSVQHPHIVTVYDAGVDEDGPYVVMELIDGKTLDEMVERGTLTWTDLREIALQSQEALIAAQDLDLVHRDLKPSNVMVCWLPSGKFQVKIVDFGLAKFSATPSLQTIDHGDAVFGSIFFMAPEQFERTPLDKRTDMYALGCLYYYSLTGEFPFNGETAAAVMASHLQHHVTPLHELRPDIPQWAADWVMWHIERSMDARPADARAALERLLILDKQSTQPITLTAPATAEAAAIAQPASGTPKLIFPGTTPIATPNPASPAAQITPAQESSTTAQEVSAVNPQTAPQPIAPPQDATGKISPHTQAQQVSQPTTALQTVSSPAQPGPTPTISPSTPAPIAAATAPTVGSPPPTHQPATQAPAQAPGSNTQGEAETPHAAVIPNKKAGIPKGAKWAIAGLLALVLVVACIVGISIMGERKETKLVNAVMLEAKGLDDDRKLRDGISLTEDELQGVLNRATNTESNTQRPLVLKVLAFSKAEGGYNANSMIIEHVTNAKCPENIRKDIFESVMTRRKDVSNIAPLLAFAKSTSEKTSAAAAINAARASAIGEPADEYINDFLDLIKDTESVSVRGAAERAAADLIEQSDDKEQFTSSIVGAYETSLTPDAKFAMLRLAGAAGGAEASKTVKSALNSNDIGLQNAAITALRQWADASEFGTLTEFINNTQNDQLHRRAFDAAYSFLRTHTLANRDPKMLGKLWTNLAKVSRGPREKLNIISGMANQKEAWALPVLALFLKDEDDKVVDKAGQATVLLKRRISANQN